MPDENTICVYQAMVTCWCDPQQFPRREFHWNPSVTYCERNLTAMPEGGTHWTDFSDACSFADRWNAEHEYSKAIVVEKLLQRCY